MNKRSLTLALFLLLFHSLSSLGQAIVIPMDISTTRPIVEVKINGEGPYKFIFDTGSGTNVIDQGLAEKLGLKVVGEDALRTQGPTQIMSKRMEAETISLEGTGISKKGTLNAINLRAMLPVDGILGNTFAEDYLVTLNYPGSKLKLERAALDEGGEGVIPFLSLPRIVNLNIDVAGKAVEAHLDTGSPGGFSLPYAMKDRLRFKEPLREGDNIRTPVASYKPWHGELMGDIRVGDVVFHNPNVVLVEGFETANIGYQIIKDLVVTIDRKNNLIRFAKPEVQANANLSVTGSETNEFTGWYGNKVREVYLENGEMYLRRNEFKLKLVQIEGDLYEMVYHIPVNNELPNVRFDRDENRTVIGLTFIYKNGREDKVRKD